LKHLTSENIALWFGKYMTERKYLEHTDEEPLELDAEEWQAALAEGQLLWRHPSARVAFHTDEKGTMLFADGEAICCSRELAELVCEAVEISWQAIKPLVQNPMDRAAITQLINLETLLVDE
jgi:50S ribosomal protein L16 3-hydroxylase